MRRRNWVGVAVTALVAAVAVGIAPAYAGDSNGSGAGGASAGGVGAGGAGIDWQPCPDEPSVDCGTLTVPIDWSVPRGPTVGIAVARRRATDPAARVGSLVINPGGPGMSGVDAVKGNLGQYFPDEVDRRFDLVGFDPRGVAGSHQIKCRATPLSPADLLPATTEQFRRLLEANRADGESCRALTGPLFDFVDTVSVVRDLDAIRAALGERRLTFYGISYGTLMGQQYARLFPERVRGIVLDSTVDHSLATTWSFLRSETVAVQEAFDEYVAWCQRSAECALHGRDVRRVFADLYARAERGELLEPGTSELIDPLVLLDETQFAFSGPYWRSLSEREASLLAGTPQPVEARARRYGRAPAGGEPAKGEPAGDEVVEDPSGIFCADWRLPVRDVAEAQGYLRRLATVAPDMKLSTQAWGAIMRCAGWPAAARDPQEPLRWRGVPPVLMLNSRYDPATPYEWARNVARQSGAVLLTYDGWGHGVYSMGSACGTAAVERYLIELRTPPGGTHCPAVEPGTTAVTKAAPAAGAKAAPPY